MQTKSFNPRRVLRFRQFSRKGYALFSCLGKEVLIGTLSVATLTYAKADSISIEPMRPDTAKTSREVRLDEVNVTGSRAPLTRGQQARMVTVLDRADIQAAPAQSMNDLLKYAVGVDVRQRGPIGAQTDVSIRGGNYEQITLLLNGINICDPQTGHNAFDFPLDIADVERIEVLEGPAGRVYGTSSLVGAINIVTRQHDKNTLDAHLEGGSYGYLSAGARASFSNSPLSNSPHSSPHSPLFTNSLSANLTRSDGYSRNKAGRLNADYQGAKVFYQGHYDAPRVRVNWHAGLSTRGFGSNTFYGAKWDDQYEHTLKSFTAIQAENKRGRFRLKPSVYWNHSADRFELFRNAPDVYPFNYHRTDVFGINLNSYFDWQLGRTALAAEWRNEDLISTNLGEPLAKIHAIGTTGRHYECGLNRTNLSFVVEHNVMLSRLTLSAGLIAVKNSWNAMSMRFYPGVDASYRIGDHLKIYASLNTSLRMPSVTELYYSVGGHQADKHLKPEELTAVEGGIKYTTSIASATMSIYHNHCRNLIDWIRHTDDADAPWESVNFTRLNALGAEASLTLHLAQLLAGQNILKKLHIAYSHIHQDKAGADGIQSLYALEYLRHKLVASLQMSLTPKLDLSLHYRYQQRTGTYTDSDGHVCDYQPYGIIDARLSYQSSLCQLYLEANNLLNKTYVDYGHVPQPGTWIIAGASLQLPF